MVKFEQFQLRSHGLQGGFDAADLAGTAVITEMRNHDRSDDAKYDHSDKRINERESTSAAVQ